MSSDVFEKDPLWDTFLDDPGNLGPDMAGIVGPTALSGGAERLAGISGEDDVEGPDEEPGIEATQIVPDRGRGKVSRVLGRDEDASGIALPLDEGAGVEAGLSEHEAKIQASAACAEGQSMPGT